MRFDVIIILSYIIFAFAIDCSLWLLHPKASRPKWRIPYFTFAALCWVLLIVAIALPWKNISSSLTPKMWLLFTWLSIYAVKLSMVIWGLIGLIPTLWKKKRIPLGMYVGLPLGLVGFAIMWWGATEGRREIETVNVEIASPQLPQNFNNFRIAQISDLHLGTWGKDTSFIHNLVDSVNAQKPDLIVFTGDIVNRDAAELKPFIPVLKRLSAPCGVITIMGNHDYATYGHWPSKKAEAANEQLVRSLQREMGWRMLENSHLALCRANDSIIILGVENWGEPPFSAIGDLHKALTQSVDSGAPLQPYGPEFKILLSHNPEHWRQHVRHESNTDLTLSGHTHAMQTQIKRGDFQWSPAAWRYMVWGGLYASEPIRQQRPSYLYVNIGAGEVGLPFRIGATPEITVFTLKSAKTASTPLPEYIP